MCELSQGTSSWKRWKRYGASWSYGDSIPISMILEQTDIPTDASRPCSTWIGRRW